MHAALSPHRRVSRAERGADQLTVMTQTEDATMHLLAEGCPISLLLDLADPAGPDSEDILAHEA